MPIATLHAPVQRLVRHRSPRTAAFVCLLLVGTLACNDLSGLAGKQALPAGTVNPSSYNTAAGALALYQATVAAFSAPAVEGITVINAGSDTVQGNTNGAAVNFVMLSGLLTDELQTAVNPNILYTSLSQSQSLDARQLPEGQAAATDRLYQILQGIRGGASEGIGALAAYDSGSAALRGHLYALEGYAEIYLADLFCSGVPLSTLNFNSATSFTYAPSATTTQVYQDAIAKFDTALTLSSDSARFLNLARVGRGRAFLALGQYDSAAAAVASVPQGFTYQIAVNWGQDLQDNGEVNVFDDPFDPASVANDEGINGLPFRSNGDPRDLVQEVGLLPGGQPYYAPLKYGGMALGIFPLTVADWVEARLIQAEAALQAGEAATWLQQLNYLRNTGTVTTTTTAEIELYDTLWVTGCATDPEECPDSVPSSTNYAGLGYTTDSVFTVPNAQEGDAYNICYDDEGSTGKECTSPWIVVAYGKDSTEVGTRVSGLAPLTDPGSDSARVSLMFQEREYWLFLTGHRQGDLRRLIRQYGRDPESVYPTGVYSSRSDIQYGTDVTAPIPAAESSNPGFHGCLSRGA